MKSEIPDSPVLKDLPATPQSNSGPENITMKIQSTCDVEASTTAGIGPTGAHDSEGTIVEEGDETVEDTTMDIDESDFDAIEDKKFVLAPTPAQLGRAPLQRRQMGKSLLIEFNVSDYY